jgi:hypothetical protein
MSLGTEQERFTLMIAKLIVWAYDQGYRIRMGDVFAKTGHRPNSNHYLKLAADLLIYSPGGSEQDTEAHRRMHDAWDTMGGAPRIESDMNHYSIIYQGKW